jgi:hypothetical protein
MKPLVGSCAEELLWFVCFVQNLQLMLQGVGEVFIHGITLI